MMAEGMSIHICEHCDRIHFDGVGSCGVCGSELTEKAISGRGSVYSFTEVHIAPGGMDAPYLLAMIELEGAGRLLARLEGVDLVAVDASVIFDGISRLGPYFRLERVTEKSHG
ncbi:MAG: hypothetical protein HOJ95_14750 [Nitrospinaceae bacterium]|jgi:uncharacterized OB-fold protein|nr:hypothetical protein [Nitrospinaceae bacterium]MBT3821121.1 hypothetical protein [Nitrospinaceae bacterium]MBT4095324.1 hypothetical protein [Nitrospinaceae bacterium]MBT5368920.1 hypothetical protein [Nitrospinaceae bacterium]MBT5948390.1 hypothetical protein [Nitrospinaceae bacterium]